MPAGVCPPCPLRGMLGSPRAGRVPGGRGIPELSDEQEGVGPELLGLQGQGFSSEERGGEKRG